MVYLTFVIPIYHGEKTIEALFDRICSYCIKFEYSYEVIFVWDCGPDRSWDLIQNLMRLHPDLVFGIKLPRNIGQHDALMCGLSKATGTYVVTLDEDLQQDPYDVEKLLLKQKQENADVVYGKFSGQCHSSFRNFSSKVVRGILTFSITNLHKDYSPLRLIKYEIAKLIPEVKTSYAFIDGHIAKLTKNVTSSDVVHGTRVAGKSSYTIRKLFKHTIKIFFSFATLESKICLFSVLLAFMLSIFFWVS